MNIVFFSHPSFLGHQSMPRFAHMLAEGMRARGHKVAVWAPEPYFTRLPAPRSVKKWLGYLDQYLIFPMQVRRRVRNCVSTTLFSFTDQALGPWIPAIGQRPRVVHCHDFLAQRSALGEISENPTGWTGRYYQHFIWRGYSQGQHFISVSERTREDLHRFLPTPPLMSEVVYNGLNQDFTCQNIAAARQYVSQQLGLEVSSGYVLHVGGNHFYKNRIGVIEIYDAWRASSSSVLPLVMLGEVPNATLNTRYAQSPYRQDIQLVSGVDDATVRAAYAGASAFLFPSLAEGFGWPIAEAMASGCPVITTDEAPMTEVAGDAGFLIPRRPEGHSTKATTWAAHSAYTLEEVVTLAPSKRQLVVETGLRNALRFSSQLALTRIEALYEAILTDSQS